MSSVTSIAFALAGLLLLCAAGYFSLCAVEPRILRQRGWLPGGETTSNEWLMAAGGAAGGGLLMIAGAVLYRSRRDDR